MFSNGSTSHSSDQEEDPPGSTRRHSLPGEVHTPISEGWPNLWSAATLSNYSGIIRSGYRRVLQVGDLVALQRKYTTEHCWKAFQTQWDAAGETVETKEPSKQSTGGTSTSTGLKKDSTRSMNRTLIRAFWEFVVCSSCLELVFDVARLLPVFALSNMILFMESDEPLRAGYKNCALLLVNNLGIAFLLNWLNFSCASGGAQMRSALIGAIYHKSLVVTKSASRRFTTGDLLNLMSVDVDNVFEFVQYSTLLWGSFVRISSSIAVVWLYLGPSCLAGLLVVLICIPLTMSLSGATARYQTFQSSEKDKRLDALNDIFSGIKIIKLFAWEIPFIDKVENIRSSEVGWIRKYLLGQAAIMFVWDCGLFMVSTAAFGTYVLVDKANILTPDKAFISLFLFNNMRLAIIFLPVNITLLLKAIVSLERIRRYLLLEEISKNNVSHDVDPGENIRFQDVSVSWQDSTPVLSDLNFSIKSGELVAVIGRMGSGKSSLLHAMLGELEKLSGSINVRNFSTGVSFSKLRLRGLSGWTVKVPAEFVQPLRFRLVRNALTTISTIFNQEPIAYVRQKAWIQNETVRRNILFTAPYEPDWYREVLKKCCLESDLKMFAGGDLTEIGEKGANLSGGQKQRISLARAVYQKAGLYLLDDPFSAVDAQVSTCLFENVIGPNGLLRGATRVIVSQSMSILPFANKIFVLEDGKIKHIGTFSELKRRGSLGGAYYEKPKLRTSVIGGDPSDSKVDAAKSPAMETTPIRQGESDGISGSVAANDHAGVIAEEKVAIGAVQCSVYMNLWKYFGRITGVAVLLGFGIHRLLEVYSTVWLGDWTDDTGEMIKKFGSKGGNVTINDPKILDEIREKSLGRIKGYFYIGGGQALAIMIAGVFLALGCLAASTKLHSDMLWNILKAPMMFFDATPLGRIVNRFGKDVNILDLELYMHLDGWLDASSQVLSTLILVSLKVPIVLLFVVPVGMAYFALQKVYMGAARQFRRLLSATRSPVLNNFSETINGMLTIRAYKAETFFIEKCHVRVDLNQNCYFHSIIASRWAALRADIMSSFLTAIICFLVATYRDVVTAGVAGLILSYSLLACDSMNWMIIVSIDVEKAAVSAERIEEYARIESEAPWEAIDGPVLEGHWPSQGEISFVNYSTRYRTESGEVLKKINLEIKPGEKVGIVGRTGAGKSTLALAIFRILEATEGKILIDNVDISRLGLHVLRRRLTMIPQEPILFKGTLRSNLDPQSLYTDEELWSALRRSHLKNDLLNLAYEIAEAGDNLSVGERQLVCLARALLRKSKVILLDEATAAVDMSTDALIQQTIRRDFDTCTIITVAHRLHTIVDYDRIVVLSRGEVIETGKPKELLKDKNSAFYSMAKESGLM